jgi:hypothetical protein
VRRPPTFALPDSGTERSNAQDGDLERHGARKIAPIMPVAKLSAKRLGQSKSADSQSSAKRISQ